VVGVDEDREKFAFDEAGTEVGDLDTEGDVAATFVDDDHADVGGRILIVADRVGVTVLGRGVRDGCVAR